MNSMGRSRKAPDSPTTSILRAYADSGSELGATPSSIQSMLKNATETGEIGLFSIRPARLPYSISQVSPRTSSLPHIPQGLPQHQFDQLSGRDHLRRRHAGDGRLHSLRSLHGTTTSSIISLYQSESQKSLRLRISHNTANEQRTFSMSGNSQIGHSLPSHRSYTGLRPRSPFAYPTRLKRPGYRPSSPALADFNGTDARTRVGLEQGMSFRTPSPLSIYAPRRETTGYPPAMNRSMPSLHRPSSPFSQSQGRASQMSSVPSRTPTLRQLPYRKIGSQPHGFYRGASQSGVWSPSQPPSPMPLYYDYSEAFEEQHHLNNPNISMLSLTEHAEWENRPPGESAELKATDSQLKHAQLEDASSPAYKSPNRSRPVVESPSPVSAPNKFLKQMSEWEREQDSTQDNIKKSVERQDIRIATDDLGHGTEVQQWQLAQVLPSTDTIGHHILSSSRPQTRDRFVKGSSRTVSEMSVQGAFKDGVTDAQVAPEVGTDISHDRSSIPYTESHPHLTDWEIPSSSCGSLALDAGQRRMMGCQLNQIISAAPSLNTDHPAIQAPVAKRSSSSRNEGDRFSRILSIEEGFAELARAVLDSGLQSDATLNTDLDTSGGSKSTPRQDSKPQSAKLSSALSFKACDSTDHSNRSSKHEHTEGLQHERVRSAIPSSCNLAPTQRPEGLSRVDTALPQPSRTGSPLVHPEETQAPGQSTKVDLRLSEPTTDTGSSRNQGYGTMPEELKDLSAAVGRSGPPHSAPALAGSHDETATIALLEAPSIEPCESDELKNDEAFRVAENKLRIQSEGASHGPLPSDIITNHQWTGLFVKRGPSLPNPLYKPQSKAKAPKFKLKITRASSSTNGTVRLPLSPTSSPRQSFGTTIDLFQEAVSRRRCKPESTLDGNSPDANLVVDRRPESGRDGIITQTSRSGIRPSSPTLHFAEVRSFFSDDSSNGEQKSSLRQRLSQLKVIAHRGNSTDELRNADRRQARSGIGQVHGSRADSERHNRPTSVQSGGTTRKTSDVKQTRWKLGGRLKSWWHRGGDKLKSLGKKVKGGKKRSVSSDLYAGV